MSTDLDTVRSYDAVAAEYAAEAAAMPAWVATEIDAFVTELGGSGRVLEIGSGVGEMHLSLRSGELNDLSFHLLQGRLSARAVSAPAGTTAQASAPRRTQTARRLNPARPQNLPTT